MATKTKNKGIRAIRMKRKLNFLFFISVIFFAISFCQSCSDTSKFSGADFYEFGSEGLTTDFAYVFSPFKDLDSDSIPGDYSLAMIIRYSNKMNMAEIPLEIEWWDKKENTFIKKNILFQLISENEIKGKGNFGIYESEKNILSVHDPEKDFYVNIKSSKSDIKGIITLGVISKQIEK